MSVSAELHAVRLPCCVRLNQRHPCVIEKGLSGRRQFDTVCAAMHQRNTDFLFEIPICRLSDGWDVCSFCSAARQTAGISHGDE